MVNIPEPVFIDNPQAPDVVADGMTGVSCTTATCA